MPRTIHPTSECDERCSGCPECYVKTGDTLCRLNCEHATCPDCDEPLSTAPDGRRFCADCSPRCQKCGELYDYADPRAKIDGRQCWDCDQQEPDPRPGATRWRLSRQEQLEGLADRGIDTLEEYRGER